MAGDSRDQQDDRDEQDLRELYIISDGTGETALASVQAATTQFQKDFKVRTFGEIRHESQVRRILERAGEVGALVIFTLVHEPLTRMLQDRAKQLGVPTLDLLGPLIQSISTRYRVKPQYRPGVLHGFSDDYFRRVEAVEFAVRHDDGANLHTLFEAELVLTGVSRTGKTPLSMYLAQRGFKTGNVPLIPGMDPPRELLEIDPNRVFGLVVDSATLVGIRKARLRQLGAPPYSTYDDAESVTQELRRARRLSRQHGWKAVDVTGKAVEENASRILELFGRRA